MERSRREVYMEQLAEAMAAGANVPEPDMLAAMAMEARREWVEDHGHEPRDEDERRDLFAYVMVSFWYYGMKLREAAPRDNAPVCPITANSGHRKAGRAAAVRWAIEAHPTAEIEAAVAELRAEGAPEEAVAPYLAVLAARDEKGGRDGR